MYYKAVNLLTRRSFSGGPNNSQARIDIFYTSNNQIDHLNRYSDTAGTNLVGKQQNTWDKAGDITEIKDTNASGTVLEDFTYQWDNGQRLTSETDTISGTPTTTNYGYDKANQLTSAGSNNYNYDLNGNRNTGGNVVGADNQLTTDGIWNYHYDPEGDMTQKVGVSGGPDAGLTWNYGYSNKNQLTSAVETNAQNQVVVDEEIKYDVKGQRVEQDVTQNNTTTYLKMAFDLEGDAWADFNSSLSLQDRRLYRDAVDALFASIGQTGNLDDYLTDHLGSVRGLENTAGTLDDTINYTVWGSPTDSSPSNGDRYKYTGREWDSAISLQYNRARYYDPSTGRWLSQDPLGFGAGDSNLYRYVKNNPINFTDPTGYQQNPLFPIVVNVNGIKAKVSPFYWLNAPTGKWSILNGNAVLPVDIKTGSASFKVKVELVNNSKFQTFIVGEFVGSPSKAAPPQHTWLDPKESKKLDFFMMLFPGKYILSILVGGNQKIKKKQKIGGWGPFTKFIWETTILAFPIAQRQINITIVPPPPKKGQLQPNFQTYPEPITYYPNPPTGFLFQKG